MKLSQICEEINIAFSGQDIDIQGLHTLSVATPFQISFFNDKKYLDDLGTTKAGAVFISLEYAPFLPSSTIALITDEPYLKLAETSKFFAPKILTVAEKPKLGKTCDIDIKVSFGKGVVIGDKVTIMAGVYIGNNVYVGSNTLIYPNVSIYHGSIIGENCIIHAGTVIGSDGYGFAHTKQGEHVKIYQNGNVIIENDVEIGANCVVDRAVFGTTYIRKGSKLDNLIQVAHNCDLGEYSLLASQVGLAGSTTTGRNVVMGGQSGSAGHLHIDDFTTIAGKGGVTKSLKGHKTYAGFPAIDHKTWLRLQAKLAFFVKRK
ncbi:MAG: UDP-3-O-[3-hydroxymyristoyl] glucosamine N-acyltransferase (EC [uncultured Sulfurovum sp.]|uniref:UDP-3-O-acylglucosamine N-acyltransferase n=1 Tax=uncultured Sulfurovum sp. TaxID=269237 RepID=A0A6S6TMY5_9BACT|nr:MAG: UDP-3-O-[3-hydroxymyristoyl] glucosamine N-acyltransferase (EC [uncultured Sulfurovum sp.]